MVIYCLLSIPLPSISLASCAMVRPWEALVVGGVGASLTLLAGPLLDKLRVDDPVSAVAVHGVAGAWVSGTLCAT